jgi:hypothetical protein
MPVDTEHPEYIRYKPMWQKIVDCLDGEDAIKAGGYVPMLEALRADRVHGAARMQAYIDRGVFSNATDRTASALVGAIFRKEPDFEVPERLMPRMDNINGAGDTIFTFSKHVVEHVLTLGRYGLFIDWPEEGEDLLPFIAGYDAFSIRSWRTRNVGGRPKLDQVILYEEIQVPAYDGFGSEIEPQYRVLELDPEGRYIQRLFVRALEEPTRTGATARRRASNLIPGTIDSSRWVERVVESRPDKGKEIDYIPFIFLSPHHLRETVSKPPFLDLANHNIAHFKGSVALEHGRFYTAHGTPYITGYAKPGNPSDPDSDAEPWDYGPENIWFIPEADAKVGMLQFSGDGLGYLENGQAEKERHMAFLGARLMDSQKRAVEAAETHEIRQSSENGTLAGAANSVSLGFEWCLQKMSEWVRQPKKKCTFRLNTDFFDKPLDPALLEKVMGALQAGHYPPSAWFWFLKEGELLPPEMTAEEAEEELDTMGPTITARNMILPEEDDDMASKDEEKPATATRDEEGGRSGDNAASGARTRSTGTTGGTATKPRVRA